MPTEAYSKVLAVAKANEFHMSENLSTYIILNCIESHILAHTHGQFDLPRLWKRPFYFFLFINVFAKTQTQIL